METNNQDISAQSDKPFSPTDFIRLCLNNWKWFAASIIVFLIIGYFYGKSRQPIYQSTASVLIKEQNNGRSMMDVSQAFSSMGLVNSNVSVNNELIAFTSPAIMFEVVKRLGLDVSYSTKGTFHDNVLYGKTLPVLLGFGGLSEHQVANLKMRLEPDGRITLYDFKTYTESGEVESDKEIQTTWNLNTVKTPAGNITVRRNPAFVGRIKKPLVIEVWRSGMQSSVEKYCAAVKGTLHDKVADVIDLRCSSVSPEMAIDILKAMIQVYNEKWVEDKNIIAHATSDFINERLALIEKDLGTVDADISNFKSEHLIPDVEAASRMYLEKSVRNEEDILDINNKLMIARYMRDFINNPAHATSVLPVNTGIGDINIETQISEYNKMLLGRNNIAANSSESNPVVKDYDASLTGMRQAIMSTINQVITALSTSLRNTQGARGEAREQIASNPSQAKYLLSVERQQKVKESLYLFLLEKREENELTQTFTSYNTRIITPPTTPLRPVSPKKQLIMLVSAIIGLIIPAVALYMAVTLDTKVRRAKDLEALPIPFAGEIPGETSLRRRLFSRRKKREEGKTKPVVEHGNRNAINEAFRVMRSNLDFMGNKNDRGKVVMLTSYFPGSGKSFISLNLAMTYAIKGKRVLLIDGDLRHGSTSAVIGNPEEGITNYLAEKTDNWRKLVVPTQFEEHLFVMPIGHKAPNPAELLENGRFDEMIREARETYDIIIIDCPPDTIVADPQLIAGTADRTVFVIRAGIFDKSLLNEVMRLYNSKKYKGMSIVLNDVRQTSTSPYGYYYGSSYYYYSK